MLADGLSLASRLDFETLPRTALVIIVMTMHKAFFIVLPS